MSKIHKFRVNEKHDFKSGFKNFYSKIPSYKILNIRIIDVFENKYTIAVYVKEADEKFLDYSVYPLWGEGGTAYSLKSIGIENGYLPHSISSYNNIDDLISELSLKIEKSSGNTLHKIEKVNDFKNYNLSKIETFDNFKTDKFKNIKPVNEFFGGIIKKLLQNAKNDLAIKFSKRVGGAGEADKAIENYKKQVFGFLQQEVAAEKTLIEYELGMEESGGDESGLKAIKDKLAKEQQIIDKQKEAAKQKFSLQINKIIDGEEDSNIKSYVKIKRAELAEQLLANELEELRKVGAEKLEKDAEFKARIEEKEKQALKMNQLGEREAKRLEDALKNKESGNSTNYEKGDKVKYNKKDGSENEGEVTDQDGVEDGFVKLKTDANQNGFIIQKDKIVGKIEDIEAGVEAEAESDKDMADATGEENK